MKRATYILLCLALCMTTALSGCWWYRNQREPNFGYSVRQAKKAQIINPNTGNTEPVTGMDGEAANAALQSYRDSFGEGSGSQDILPTGSGLGGQ